MSKPIVYGPGFSTYVRTVRLVLEEKKVDYDLVEINFLQGPMPEEQIERHPFARVPAFEHDGFSFYESAAITRYVDEAFEGPVLQPAGVRERARMTQIISILDAYTYPCTITNLVIQRLVMPMLGNQPDESIISAAIPKVEKCMSVLCALLGDNKFMAGAQLSLADLHFIPIFDYFQNTPESKAILDRNTGLRGWWQRTGERDSVLSTKPAL